MVQKVIAVVAVGLTDFGHIYVSLGGTCKSMVHVTERDPATVVGAAAVRDGTAECRMCFRTEVAFAV